MHDEVLKLQEYGKIHIIKELDAVPLRKALVDLYPHHDLISKFKEDLWQLSDYTSEEDKIDNLNKEWKERMDKSIKTLEIDDNILPLRAELKSLRERVAWYDQTWAKGEIFLNITNYWTVISVIILLLMGIVPIVLNAGTINILHWIFLGLSGALLSSIISNRKLDLTDLGEEEGKEVISKTVSRMAIGAMTALLLYVALLGGILGGSAFPILPLYRDMDKYEIYTGMSVFWAIAGGFSLNILSRMVNVADKAMGAESE